MKNGFSHFLQKPKWLLAGFGVAVFVTGFFAIRFTVSMIYWADPAHLDQQIQGWMTPRYVAQSWQVHPEVIRDALGLDLKALNGKRLTMERIALQRDVSLDVLEASIIEAVTLHRALK